MFEGLLQPMHLLLILGVALVVFGPKRLPEIGKALGEAIRGFKNTLNEAASESVKPAEISKKQDDGTRSD
jgi:sec-independent protein translocase protein TatA